MIQDAFWKKSQENCNKIDSAAKNLGTIAEYKEKELSLADDRKKVYENILGKSQSYMQSSNTKPETSTFSNHPAKTVRDKLSLPEILHLLSIKSSEDLNKLKFLNFKKFEF